MAEAETTAAPASAPAPAGSEGPGAKLIKKVKELELPNRIHTWPYLVRIEFLCAVIVMTVVTIWSITIDAPLEEPANPNRTPNPSKAPWYFLGLQEMLVYFDPWMAGVVLPSLIIVGLMVVPYIDVNTKGNGYYTFKERKFAVTTFLFGFLVLWILLIILGTFFRGPGWYLFMPGQYWDQHKTVALTNVDLPYQLGFRREWPMFFCGAFFVAGWYMGLPMISAMFFKKKWPVIYEKLGTVRFAITANLFWIMMSLPMKVFLRLAFNTKYIWTTKYINF
jgi:uncharacterized membrane protein